MEPVIIEGIVAEGQHLGRRIGFPTANLPLGADTAVEDGVYASVATVSGRRYRAMSNVGCNPSVGGAERRVETHIFGFDETLYGRPLRVELGLRIRGERRFGSIDELRAQIARDKEYITNLNNR